MDYYEQVEAFDQEHDNSEEIYSLGDNCHDFTREQTGLSSLWYHLC